MCFYFWWWCCCVGIRFHRAEGKSCDRKMVRCCCGSRSRPTRRERSHKRTDFRWPRVLLHCPYPDSLAHQPAVSPPRVLISSQPRDRKRRPRCPQVRKAIDKISAHINANSTAHNSSVASNRTHCTNHLVEVPTVEGRAA